MNVRFQALHIAFWGIDYKFEACHRQINLSLIKDAMKQVVDAVDYKEFASDIRQELNQKDELDGIRCTCVNFLLKIVIILCTLIYY
jgi:hypothetical protein